MFLNLLFLLCCKRIEFLYCFIMVVGGGRDGEGGGLVKVMWYSG